MYEGLYSLIGVEFSFFSRKLEAQLSYQEIPFNWKFKSAEITQEVETKAGTRFIPVLETPDGWTIHDTIAIGPMLNDRFYETPVIPDDSTLRALCFIVEDYFNHWFSRHVLHSRWCYEDSVTHAGRGFGMNIILGKSKTESLSAEEEEKISGMAAMMRDGFGIAACKAQGAPEDQSEILQTDLKSIIAMLLNHLENSPFIFGGRASLADFALAGALKAHFLEDPAPRSWLESELEALEQYVDKVYSGPAKENSWADFETLEPTLKPLLEHLVSHYHIFAGESIKGAVKGEKYFTCEVPSGPITARTMRRLDKSRLHVQQELKRVKAFDNDYLKASGALDYYAMPPQINK
jgi:glutathione S-transferase